MVLLYDSSIAVFSLHALLDYLFCVMTWDVMCYCVDECYYIRVLRTHYTYYNLTNTIFLKKMSPRRENRLPTTEAELQARISQVIADYEASRAETSGGTSRNNPPNGNV